MAKVPNGRYTKEFREEAVKLVTEGGFSAYEASRRLNMPKSTLENWARAEKRVLSTQSAKTSDLTGLETLATKEEPHLLGCHIRHLTPLPDILQPWDQFIPVGRRYGRGLAHNGPHHLGMFGIIGITGQSQLLCSSQIGTNSLATLAKGTRQLGDALSLLPAKQQLIKFNHGKEVHQKRWQGVLNSVGITPSATAQLPWFLARKSSAVVKIFSY